MKSPILALIAGCIVTGAAAQEAEPVACTGFDWSLQRERAWLSAPGLPHLESGATLPEAMPGAILALSSEAQAQAPVPPSREPKPDTKGGSLRLAAPVTPGPYQITLSDEAWIDVSQDGSSTRPPPGHDRQDRLPRPAQEPALSVLDEPGADRGERRQGRHHRHHRGAGRIRAPTDISASSRGAYPPVEVR